MLLLLSDHTFSEEIKGFAKYSTALIFSKAELSCSFGQDDDFMLPRNEVIVYFFLWKILVDFPVRGAKFIIPSYYMMNRHL